MQGKAFAALDKLEAQGNQLRFPHTDIIQDGLFELRAGKKILLVLFSLSPKVKNIHSLYIRKENLKDTTFRNQISS